MRRYSRTRKTNESTEKSKQKQESIKGTCLGRENIIIDLDVLEDGHHGMSAAEEENQGEN